MENKLLRYALYIVGFSISSEIIYQALKMFEGYVDKRRCKSKLKSNLDKDEICDVLFSNHISDSCLSNHGKSKEPCDNKYCYSRNIKRIILEINKAQKTIDLALYMFTLVGVSDALKNAVQRGVKIRIIGDESMVCNENSLIYDLHNDAGIPIRVEPEVVMHHKFCIIDGQQINEKEMKNNESNKIRPILITGSANWTFQAFTNNFDSVIITSNRLLINKYQEEFNRIWETK